MKEDSSYKTGIELAPKVDCEVSMVNDDKDKRHKWWVGTICIGDEYYETDQYKSRDYAVSEMLGCLEFLELYIKTEIEYLKGIIK